LENKEISESDRKVSNYNRLLQIYT